MTLLTKAAALKWLSWTAALVFNLTSLSFPPIVSLPSTPPLLPLVLCFVLVYRCLCVCFYVLVYILHQYLCRITIVTKIKWPRDARFSSCNDQTFGSKPATVKPLSIPGANFAFSACLFFFLHQKTGSGEGQGTKAMQSFGKVCFGHSPSYRRFNSWFLHVPLLTPLIRQLQVYWPQSQKQAVAESHVTVTLVPNNEGDLTQ